MTCGQPEGHHTVTHLIWLLLFLAYPLRAQLPDAHLGSAERVRFHGLCRRLMAPCCWTQSVEIHSSPAADQTRTEVAAMILAGQSDREILDSFIRRYGERILAEPEGVKSVVLTTVPIVVLSCCSAILIWFLSRRRHPRAPAPFDVQVDLAPDPEWE